MNECKLSTTQKMQLFPRDYGVKMSCDALQQVKSHPRRRLKTTYSSFCALLSLFLWLHLSVFTASGSCSVALWLLYFTTGFEHKRNYSHLERTSVLGRAGNLMQPQVLKYTNRTAFSLSAAVKCLFKQLKLTVNKVYSMRPLNFFLITACSHVAALHVQWRRVLPLSPQQSATAPAEFQGSSLPTSKSKSFA